jgi:hypothetical protein
MRFDPRNEGQSAFATYFRGGTPRRRRHFFKPRRGWWHSQIEAISSMEAEPPRSIPRRSLGTKEVGSPCSRSYSSKSQTEFKHLYGPTSREKPRRTRSALRATRRRLSHLSVCSWVQPISECDRPEERRPGAFANPLSRWLTLPPEAMLLGLSVVRTIPLHLLIPP